MANQKKCREIVRALIRSSSCFRTPTEPSDDGTRPREHNTFHSAHRKSIPLQPSNLRLTDGFPDSLSTILNQGRITRSTRSTREALCISLSTRDTSGSRQLKSGNLLVEVGDFQQENGQYYRSLPKVLLYNMVVKVHVGVMGKRPIRKGVLNEVEARKSGTVKGKMVGSAG